MLSPFAIVAITSEPKSAPRTSPRPPKRLQAADHCCGDRVDQQRSPAGERATSGGGGEDDAADRGHAARDHEDDGPDSRDVDACAPGGLGVAAHSVDVAAEGRPFREERPEDQEPDDQEGATNGTPRSLVADLRRRGTS